MTIKAVMELVSAVLAITAYFPYIRAIIKGETRPSKASWIIWMVLSLLTAGGMYQAGTLNFQISIIAFSDIVVVLLAIKHGTPGWNVLEKGCLVGAAAGLSLWAFTQNPEIAVVLGLGVTIVGSFPTIAKTWVYPEQEAPLAYTLMVLSCVAQIVASKSWEFMVVGQAVVFLAVSGTILVLILVRPRSASSL